MDDYDDEQEETPDRASRNRRRRAEGVRIIGAEEAARALREGQAAGRRPEDAPRYGDVPERPSAPPSAQRFPLSPRGRRGAKGGARAEPEAPEMQHWTEAPSGEVPQILGGGEQDDTQVWSSLPTRAPRWRDGESDWADDLDDVAVLADDESRLGALDDSRTEHSDLFSFDEPEVEPPSDPVTVTSSIRPRRAAAEPPSPVAPGTNRRDMRSATVLGAGLALLALLLFKAGPVPSLLLATAAVTLAAAELYNVLQRAGYRPATLLGLTATVSLMIAAYSEGETALPLVISMTVLFSFLWYLLGVVRARPTVNIAVTVLAFGWIGVLGSYAALLLAIPDRRGIAFLLGAIVATVGYDLGGLFFGTQMGSRPLAPEISPSKTVEGLVGGMATAVFVSVLVVGVLPGIEPWTAGKALLLGLVVALVAPLGDLCESMIKRDLGVKDMGSLLPGHGGVLDRFDALLFVLPATYYLVKLLDLA